MAALRRLNVPAAAVSTGATGTLATYTASKSQAMLRSAVLTLSAGATVALQVLPSGGGTLTVRSDTASYRDATDICLNVGDTVRLQITGALAGTADAILSIEENY